MKWQHFHSLLFAMWIGEVWCETNYFCQEYYLDVRILCLIVLVCLAYQKRAVCWNNVPRVLYLEYGISSLMSLMYLTPTNHYVGEHRHPIVWVYYIHGKIRSICHWQNSILLDTRQSHDVSLHIKTTWSFKRRRIKRLPCGIFESRDNSTRRISGINSNLVPEKVATPYCSIRCLDSLSLLEGAILSKLRRICFSSDLTKGFQQGWLSQDN